MRTVYQPCTITFYNDQEDQYGEITSKPNPEGKFKAIHGFTVAVDPKVIPYFSELHIPELKDFSRNGDGIFYAHDTGTDVVSRRASVARGNNFPVIDVFARVSISELPKMNEKYGETATYKILKT